MAEKNNFESEALVHLDALYRAAFALCANPSDAEDLVQQTCLKAYEKFGSFKKGTNCRAWLLRILRNNWVDRLRRMKHIEKSIEIDDDLLAQPEMPEETTWTDCTDLLDNFSDPQIISALGKLPDDNRLTLFLVDVEQMSHEEVARIMDVAPGTVKSRTSRARAALKEQLRAHAKEMGFDGGKK